MRYERSRIKLTVMPSPGFGHQTGVKVRRTFTLMVCDWASRSGYGLNHAPPAVTNFDMQNNVHTPSAQMIVEGVFC
jgi:hypothetical protein